MAKAVFLDRDGTIIADKNFLSTPDGIEILPGVTKALRGLKKAGFLLILITNQSGVGRGYFPEKVVDEIHERLQALLKNEGISLDAIYLCPHHPEDNCECRKPKTGLFLKAIQKFKIDPSKSYCIGDKPSDVEAGKKAGCKTIFIGEDSASADYRAVNFPEAVEYLLTQEV